MRKCYIRILSMLLSTQMLFSSGAQLYSQVQAEGLNQTISLMVQAVLDNESTWKADIAACDTVLSSMTSEGNPQSSLDTDDTFWFQDLDMDGTPEFIVESKTGDVGYGDFFEKAWNVYYLKDSSLAKYQGADSIGDVQSTVNLFYNDESEVVYQLYKDNTTGKFVNLREGYGWSVVYGRLSLLHLGNNSWEQDLLTAMDEDIPEKGCELSEDASSPTEASSKNLSYAEAVEWYNSYKSNLTAYSYTTKKINLFDWDSMSSEEKQQALEDSYNAWNYGEGSTEDFPLSAVMKQVESQASAAEQTQSQSTYKDAYKQKIQELSANTASLNTIDYCLCDMNADGIPELIVITGTCEADYVITFYTYKNDAVTVIGDGFSGWHSSFHYDSDTKQFCTQWGQMGVGGIRWYAFDGNTVTETNSVDNIEYDTLEVHFDNYDDAYAPYGTFSDVETAYCYYSNSDGWTTSYYTPTADGSYATEEYFGIDYSLIDNYVVTNSNNDKKTVIEGNESTEDSEFINHHLSVANGEMKFLKESVSYQATLQLMYFDCEDGQIHFSNILHTADDIFSADIYATIEDYNKALDNAENDAAKYVYNQIVAQLMLDMQNEEDLIALERNCLIEFLDTNISALKIATNSGKTALELLTKAREVVTEDMTPEEMDKIVRSLTKIDAKTLEFEMDGLKNGLEIVSDVSDAGKKVLENTQNLITAYILFRALNQSNIATINVFQKMKENAGTKDLETALDYAITAVQTPNFDIFISNYILTNIDSDKADLGLSIASKVVGKIVNAEIKCIPGFGQVWEVAGLITSFTTSIYDLCTEIDKRVLEVGCLYAWDVVALALRETVKDYAEELKSNQTIEQAENFHSAVARYDIAYSMANQHAVLYLNMFNQEYLQMKWCSGAAKVVDYMFKNEEINSILETEGLGTSDKFGAILNMQAEMYEDYETFQNPLCETMTAEEMENLLIGTLDATLEKVKQYLTQKTDEASQRILTLIACPMVVEIYDENNNLVATVGDGKLQYEISDKWKNVVCTSLEEIDENGTALNTYCSVILIPDDYTCKASSTDSGEADIRQYLVNSENDLWQEDYLVLDEHIQFAQEGLTYLLSNQKITKGFDMSAGETNTFRIIFIVCSCIVVLSITTIVTLTVVYLRKRNKKKNR